MATRATAQPRRRIPHRCRATTRGFRIRLTNPATAIINRTSRMRYASLPARYTRTTTATVTRMVASGTPRLAAASRRRPCRTCPVIAVPAWAGAAVAVPAWAGSAVAVPAWAGPAVAVPAWAGPAVAVSAWAGPPGPAAIMGCTSSCDEAGTRTGG